MLVGVIHDRSSSRCTHKKSFHCNLVRSMPRLLVESDKKTTNLPAFSSFNTLSIPLLHASFHLFFSFLLRIFPVTGASNILLSMCPSSLLLTCPCHFSLFSVIFDTGATFTDPLTCSFLLLNYHISLLLI